MINNHSLLERIRHLQSEGSTGVLCLTRGEDQISVFFDEGLLEAASSNLPDFWLGQYLLRNKMIEPSALKQLLRKSAKAKAPLGELLVRGGILDPHWLIRVLTGQVADLLNLAMEGDFKIEHFRACVKNGDSRPTGVGFSFARSFKYPLCLTADQITLELARRKARPLSAGDHEQLGLDPANKLESLHWAPREIAVLMHLRQPSTLRNLVERTGFAESETRKILQVFRELGMLQILNGKPADQTALVKVRDFPMELLVPNVEQPFFDEKVIQPEREHTFVSEQFNFLKVNLNQVRGLGGARIIQVSSADLQEGKTLTACNLALSIARDLGHRVLLLDGDLRHPAVHRKLGISLGPGLVQYLSDERLVPECCLRRLDRLYVMTAGDVLAHSVSLFSMPRMSELVTFLRQHFDFVIVDSPPLLPIADAKVISGMADYTVMVVRRGKTRYGELGKALREIDPQKLAGVVLTEVEWDKFDVSYPYYSAEKKKRYETDYPEF